MNQNLAAALVAIALAGCAQLPVGPSVAVMPARGKPFEQFAQEERTCRQYAEDSLGLSATDAASRNFVGSAVTGTAIGAAAGALAGGHEGAAAGAAVGLVAGSAIGSNMSGYAAADAQRRYDVAYQQCMYAKGNQLPRRYAYSRSPRYAPRAYPPAYYPPADYPPPPPGYGW